MLFLGIIAAIAGGVLLRNPGGQRDQAKRVGPDSKLAPAARAPEARAITAAGVDAGNTERAKLSGAEGEKPPAGTSEPRRAVPIANHERAGAAVVRHRAAHPGRGSETANAPPAGAVTPKPDHAAASSAAAQSADELFRDRK